MTLWRHRSISGAKSPFVIVLTHFELIIWTECEAQPLLAFIGLLSTSKSKELNVAGRSRKSSYHLFSSRCCRLHPKHSRGKVHTKWEIEKKRKRKKERTGIIAVDNRCWKSAAILVWIGHSVTEYKTLISVWTNSVLSRTNTKPRVGYILLWGFFLFFSFLLLLPWAHPENDCDAQSPKRSSSCLERQQATKYTAHKEASTKKMLSACA